MRAVVVAALLVLAWPATASAVDYGGGTPADSTQRAQRQLTTVGLRTRANGTATVWVTVAARCGTGLVTRDVALGADGSFAFRRTVRDRIGGGVRRTARIRVNGLVAGTSASGSASAKLSFRRHGRVTAKCSSGTRGWQTRAPISVGAPSPARPNTAYYGITSQQGSPSRVFPLVLKVDAGGRRVSTASFDYHLRCMHRAAYDSTNITPGAPIAADGSFHLLERFTIHWAEGNERFRVTVDGRFATDGMTGTVNVRSVLRSRRTGRLLDRCTTGSGQSFAAVP
ncbi:MAG TPA: hypothetical protein VFX51_00930 [Solirubrobacteraceae bacterium]|nr:hypothetical protein [Solirubrobacteraceae bacterium]